MPGVPGCGLTDTTIARPTGSAACVLLPAPAEPPVAGPEGVASTSTVSPAARSGGNWPALTATPSIACPADGGAGPMSPAVSRLPADSAVAAVCPATAASWGDGMRLTGPSALTRAVVRSAAVITCPAATVRDIASTGVRSPARSQMSANASAQPATSSTPAAASGPLRRRIRSGTLPVPCPSSARGARARAAITGSRPRC